MRAMLRTLLLMFGGAMGAIFVLSSCTSDMSAIYGGTVSGMRKLSVGASRAEVIAILGAPDGTEVTQGQETLRYNDRLRSVLSGSDYAADYFVTLRDGSVVSYGKVENSSRQDPRTGGSPESARTLSNGKRPSMTCMKAGDTLTGFTRQCSYDCLGSLVIKTLSHTDLCPLTISQ